MNVAIAFYSKGGPSRDKVTNINDESQIRTYFGKKDDTIINKLEYKINTFGGFSGAAVILLEEGPEFLKDIAVHAGYKQALDINIGFKLARIFRVPNREHRCLCEIL
jgi:hypothetical protein